MPIAFSSPGKPLCAAGRAALLLSLFLPMLAASPGWLVRDGRSAYSIVLAPDASPSEHHAAAELQNFLEQISGARLPIASTPQPAMILVGRSPALDALAPGLRLSDLGPEGFALKTQGPHLIIAGGRLRGTMYGVYEFLEKLGCRWFAPGVSRIPALRSIPLPRLNETQQPSFEAREPFFAEASDPDWAARNRANGQSMRLDAARGGKVLAYPGGHSFDQLVPPQVYFKEHPEYFSLVDGKRRIDPYRSQLCLTNPDVLRIAIATVERWITEHPEATNLSVVQNDGEGWCECDNCRRVEAEEGGAHSGPVLRFVNAVAQEIGKRHPEKLIDTFAYSYTLDPPRNVRPRPNVRVRICPSESCFAHPFEKCAYDAITVRDLAGWAKITDRLYAWHYNINFLHYLLPFPDFEELTADIPAYRRYGVVGLFMEGSTDPEGGSENAALRSYVMAKLMWNIHADVPALVKEFHEAYYGRAAKPMLAYYELLQSRVRQAPHGPGYHVWLDDPPSAPYVSGDFLDRASALFRQAEAAAEDDAVRARVLKTRLAIDYLQLSRAKRFLIEGDTYRPADLDRVREMWNSLVAACRGFGISHISENSTLTEEDAGFQKLVRPYRVTTLENEHIRVHLVPELDGRITHILDKRTGRNLLREAEPFGTRTKLYPNMGGLTAQVFSDYVSEDSQAFGPWKVAPGNSGTALTLITSSDKLRLRRELSLEGGFLRTKTVVENTSREPAEALLESSWSADPGGAETALVTYRKQDGSPAEVDLRSDGRIRLTGASLPDGEWRLVNRAASLATVIRFPKSHVARCYLDREHLNANSVGMTVASPRRTLQPGESLTLEADYGVDK